MSLLASGAQTGLGWDSVKDLPASVIIDAYFKEERQRPSRKAQQTHKFVMDLMKEE